MIKIWCELLWLILSLITGTLQAYLSVLNVSSKLMSAGDNAAIIAVFEFPPRFSRKSHVSTESRYGITDLPLPFLLLAWKLLAHFTNAFCLNFLTKSVPKIKNENLIEKLDK